MCTDISVNDMIFSRFAEPSAILIFNGTDLKTETINDKYLPEIGMNIDADEYVQADFMKSFDKANREIFLEAVRKCIETHEEVSCNTWRRLISNCCGEDRINIRSRLICIDDAKGNCRIYEGIRNNTAEQRNIESLIESERKFKIASDQINIYYWEYTIATKEMRPCFRCMRDLGLPALVRNYPEPAIELGIFPPDYADMYRDWHRQLAEGVPELEADIPLTVGRVPFRVKYTTEFDAEGKPYKAYGSATLISNTEIKQHKLDLSIIESLAEEYSGIYLVDAEKDTLKVIWQTSDYADGLLSDGTYTENIARIVPLFSEEYGESSFATMDLEYIRTAFFQNSQRREFNLRHKTRGHWVRVKYQVLEEFDDKPTKFLVTFTVIDDLRAQKIESDRLIAKQMKELELQQTKLIEAVNEANRANRAKSDFLARMSHEIRTPMNAIMGMNEIIKKTTTEPIIRDYAEDAYNAATGLLGTINDILDFSRIESGHMEIVEDYYRLNLFLENIYNLFALRAEDKGLAFILDIDSQLPAELYGDELRMRQILVNLLSNAVKYTDSGTITLRAKCVARRDDAVDVRYEIIDTGRGIKQEDIQTLFEAFGRIDERNNRNIEGTGLGMNITTSLLQLMNSKLELDSEFGKGSNFSFTITQGIRSNDRLGRFRPGTVSFTGDVEAPAYVNPNGLILVVDDNVVNLKVLSALLQETQMKIVSVTSGELALRSCLRKKFDIIFMDHYMPGMDGVEAFKAIRTQENGLNRETPVVALTANAIKGADEEYKAIGFNDVVYKPTTQKDLNEVLLRQLGNN